MKFSLPQVTVFFLVLFSVTAVIEASTPPGRFEEALEGLLSLADETRATRPPANARPQAPPHQPHQREPQTDQMLRKHSRGRQASGEIIIVLKAKYKVTL
ncbi:hypothetical protein NDA11_005290 [Ustilago hordei]|uniref:Uncharacterized protein n=1 Tax=Ustilago hordei TaxID=120017 RepID=I2FZG6_USTHO|nr:uncharacterized protein UHO2_06869 [Ustilago hordei]KAJ1036782.1 hypothetical protein NDA10_008079 [Ustilago hordei]KAJ1576853.1 hypothetical protein NDA15_001356 [Ustilago hordei]KAJ1578490.1 hypothetical protein NDA12_000411 [Ustilago hordei]KAJ1584151.1 hypothetical protein NDA11_005290 [Ustilago hordei]KAJ1599115.1 hypothetical protein NDA14_002226 [Ustilago hordei]